MIKQLWINLPVKDINRSKTFFTEMGFTFNKNHPNTEGAVSLLLGEKEVVVMLFEEAIFKSFIGGEEISTRGAEVLLSIDAQSKEEVDELAKRAIEAGGSSNHKPSEMKGFMYGCLFSDPDGHRWNVLYMDYSKMPQA
jgi:predicted lactoylglutathione lyase